MVGCSQFSKTWFALIVLQCVEYALSAERQHKGLMKVACSRVVLIH